VALVPASGGALYYAEDLLGSSRVMVQANGTLCYDADFTPFGGEKSSTSTCAQNYKFEGKERDAETQNDDFGAREYSWRFGRWLSSDWSAAGCPTHSRSLRMSGFVMSGEEFLTPEKAHSPGLALVKLDFLIGTKWGSYAGRKPGAPLIRVLCE
jgi:RHS repeat-associated protein